jgi:protein transport protein SEC24
MFVNLCGLLQLLQERAVSAPPPYDMFNCSPDNMRLTVNAFPNSTALRAR